MLFVEAAGRTETLAAEAGLPCSGLQAAICSLVRGLGMQRHSTVGFQTCCLAGTEGFDFGLEFGCRTWETCLLPVELGIRLLDSGFAGLILHVAAVL